MKKRILAVLLCACMAMTGFVRAFAEGDQSGDANGDGTVTVSDASFVLRYCVGLDWRMDTRSRMLADVDCDGCVEAEDAALILRSIARLAPLQIGQTDATLLGNLQKQYYFKHESEETSAILTEWTARFIQAMPEDSQARKVLVAGAPYMGTPYGTGKGQMDCSNFVKMAFRDAGISTSVYPQTSSDKTLNWYRNNHPEQLHETDMYSWQDWTPGSVLIYVVQETGKASHLALYVGEIDGSPIVMESRSGGCDGVRLGYLMGDYENANGQHVVLTHYVNPLG